MAMAKGKLLSIDVYIANYMTIHNTIIIIIIIHGYIRIVIAS